MLMKINLSVSSDMVDGYVVCEREASTSRSPGLVGCHALVAYHGVRVFWQPARCTGRDRGGWQAVDNAVRLRLDGAGCPRLQPKR